MKRLHIHLAVDDRQQNIEFYNTLFDSKPTIQHEGYQSQHWEDFTR